ncbi:MAG: helix-turn-helix domain-containing protein [Thermoleophilaceae bacterium]|nr:helix-turn-helix domain-containing protein [Thermoleophilaceae bacterium]
MSRTHRSTLRAGEHRREPVERALVYTVSEVAARLKVSPGTVRNMIDEGQLYALRLHVRRIVVPAWALDDLVARPTRPATNVTPLSRPANSA